MHDSRAPMLQAICCLQHWDYHHRLVRALGECSNDGESVMDEGEPPEWGRDFVASLVALCDGMPKVDDLKKALEHR